MHLELKLAPKKEAELSMLSFSSQHTQQMPEVSPHPWGRENRDREGRSYTNCTLIPGVGGHPGAGRGFLMPHTDFAPSLSSPHPAQGCASRRSTVGAEEHGSERAVFCREGVGGRGDGTAGSVCVLCLRAWVLLTCGRESTGGDRQMS